MLIRHLNLEELVEYREKGGVSNLFERINDIAGPYEDHITQKFYLKYKGANIDKIDLTKYAYVNNISGCNWNI